MTYMSWEPRHRCTTIAPGKLDLFVLTLVDGTRVALDPVTDYDAALARARAFHRGPKCQVKVLPLTGDEARNMSLLVPAAKPEPLCPSDEKLVRDTLVSVFRTSNDDDARRDAFELLRDMGVVTG